MSNKAGGLRAVVTLVLITAVMALLLAAVNAITAQPIARARQEKTEKALSGVLAPGVTLAGPVEKFEDRTGLVSAVHKTTERLEQPHRVWKQSQNINTDKHNSFGNDILRHCSFRACRNGKRDERKL